MATAKSSSTLTTHCVNFIYENKAGCILLALSKQISDSRGTNAHKHFYKVGT